ncbi:hypothetical protein FRC06_009403, partial [Ceratobasidium sp. 370]
FVDRDMAVRYMPGAGIGHSGLPQSNVGTMESMIVDEVEPEINTTDESAEGFYGSDMERYDSDDSSDATVDSVCEEDQDL